MDESPWFKYGVRKKGFMWMDMKSQPHLNRERNVLAVT
jgi:hypothetical protein